jgi:hypothetical protein
MGILKHGSYSCGIITNSVKDKLFLITEQLDKVHKKSPHRTGGGLYMSLILYYLAISTVYMGENQPKPVTPTCIFMVIFSVQAEKVPICPA